MAYRYAFNHRWELTHSIDSISAHGDVSEDTEDVSAPSNSDKSPSLDSFIFPSLFLRILLASVEESRGCTYMVLVNTILRKQDGEPVFYKCLRKSGYPRSSLWALIFLAHRYGDFSMGRFRIYPTF